MPLPLAVSCFSKIQIGFTFLVPAHLSSPGQRTANNGCVRVTFMLFRPIIKLIKFKPIIKFKKFKLYNYRLCF